MIVRVTGGNVGIMQYLETGIKKDNHYSRDELDERVVLYGQTHTTQSVISKIEDKGQDRYLHFTLSFKEDNVDKQTMQNITEDYVNLIFQAYKKEEFNFYAEAHIPKIKELKTKDDETITRKPHIHLIVPKMNLLNGNTINPCSSYTKDIKYFEAIQEHINDKYNLESPKNNKRDFATDRSDIISRTKGDIYIESRKDLQKELFSKIKNKEISNQEQLFDFLKSQGEVKKSNNYFKIKLPKKENFIHLKNPIYQFKNNELKDKKERNHLLKEWQTTRSKELKYTDTLDQKQRKLYKSKNKESQNQFLKQKEKEFYVKYTKLGSATGVRDGGKRTITKSAIGMQSLSQCSLVYGIGSIQGYSRSKEQQATKNNRPHLFLSTHESCYLAENRTKIKYSELRRNYQDRKFNINNIKNEVKPRALLKFLKDNHSLKDFYKTSQNNQRIQVKNGTKIRNLNISDFLTKKLGYKWDEAKDILQKCYLKKTNNTLKKDIFSDFNKIKKENMLFFKKKKLDILQNSFNIKEKKEELSILIFEKMKFLHNFKNERNEILSEFNLNIKWQKMTNNDKNESEIGLNLEILEKAGQDAKQKQALQDYLQNTEIDINSLYHSKTASGIVEYKDKKTDKLMFTDKDDKLFFSNKGITESQEEYKAKVSFVLEFAMQKYGDVLSIDGNDNLKKTVFEVVTEKKLDIYLKPNSLNDELKEFQKEKEKEILNTFDKKGEIKTEFEKDVLQKAVNSHESEKSSVQNSIEKLENTKDKDLERKNAIFDDKKEMLETGLKEPWKEDSNNLTLKETKEIKKELDQIEKMTEAFEKEKLTNPNALHPHFQEKEIELNVKKEELGSLEKDDAKFEKAKDFINVFDEKKEAEAIKEPPKQENEFKNQIDNFNALDRNLQNHQDALPIHPDDFEDLKDIKNSLEDFKFEVPEEQQSKEAKEYISKKDDEMEM